MNPRNIFLLPFISALLLTSAWYVYPALSFVGFVPLFFLQHFIATDSSKKKNLRLFLLSYLTFLLWNIGVSWWVINSTIVGATLAFTINSLLMTLVVMAANFAEKRLKNSFPIASFTFMFIFFWLAFEYMHLDWDLSWTWLHLGNSFANAHYLIQWYEFVGAIGGSCWILIINVLTYYVLKDVDFNVKLIRPNTILWVLVGFILVPIIISLFTYYTYKENGKSNEIIVVQPNIDPYNEKFPGTSKFIPFDAQLERLIDLTQKKLTRNTRFVAWPETSLPVGYDEDLISDQEHIRQIRFLLTDHPGLTLVTGGDTYKIYHSEYDKTETARYSEGVGWYDYFNTAIKIGRKYKIDVYHKSKLVPGVEQMPLPWLFKWVEKFSINLGGITGSLGKQKERTVFFNENNVGVAPIICYESVYGEFVTEYVKKGANYLFIITNDGWWGNTPGHKQHLAYARLRAIETRRSVARAANTGISGFLNQKGDIIIQNTYWTQDVLRANIKANDKITFYVDNGDMIGVVAKYFSLFTLSALFVSVIIQRFKKK